MLSFTEKPNIALSECFILNNNGFDHGNKSKKSSDKVVV